MKNLFYLFVALFIFSGVSLSAQAQTNINVEKLDGAVHQNSSPKFIVDQEAASGITNNNNFAEKEIVKSNQSTISKPSVFQPGFVGNIELCSALQFKYAMLMDTEVESITNIALFNFIEAWWATRYKYGGNDHNGIDCSSFTGKLLSEVYGLDAPRTAKDQYAKCEKIAPQDLVEGDLVFFNISGGVSHVGLYLGNNCFVHSSVNGGVTISSLTDSYYNKKFISGGKIMVPSTPLASRH